MKRNVKTMTPLSGARKGKRGKQINPNKE